MKMFVPVLILTLAAPGAVGADLGQASGKVAVVRTIVDQKVRLGGGLVFEFEGEQFVITSLHAVPLQAKIGVEVLGGKSAEAKRVWPLQETKRDLAMLLISKRVSESPLGLSDLNYTDAETLVGAFLIGGASNGHISRERVFLSEGRNLGKRYWFFKDNFEFGASGFPIFRLEEGKLVLEGLVAGNDGSLMDDTKIKGGMAYTVRPIQQLVGEYLASKRRAALRWRGQIGPGW